MSAPESNYAAWLNKAENDFLNIGEQDARAMIDAARRVQTEVASRVRLPEDQSPRS
jgi:hypothetical protein